MGIFKKSGFTLIELITVITIIGVLAVVVGPRFASTDVYEARTFYDDVSQAIRFAQAKANASGCLTQVDFSSTGFAVQIDSDCDGTNGITPIAVISPDGFASGYTEQSSLPSGVSYSASIDPLLFDGQGRPRNSSLTILSSVTTVDVGSRRINVEGGTGYVH